MFHSNSGNAEATNPPPQYEDDGGFANTLKAVETLTAEAQGKVNGCKVEGGNLAKAHEALEGVRAQFGALHLRNGLHGFSDRMNACQARMVEVLNILIPADGSMIPAVKAALGGLKPAYAKVFVKFGRRLASRGTICPPFARIDSDTWCRRALPCPSPKAPFPCPPRPPATGSC